MTKVFIATKNKWQLIKTWVYYNIQGDYIDTKLGVLWIILQPILLTLIYTAVFTTLIPRKPREGVPFILFFLAGTTVWQFFSSNVMQAGLLLIRHLGLMSQVKFPRDTVVIVSVLEKVVDFFITFIILVLFSVGYGYFPTITYFYIPIIFVILIIMVLGFVFLLSSLGVFVRDVPQIASLILRFLFYFSGVIISPDMLSDEIAKILKWNPLLVIIESFRSVTIYSESPNWRHLSYALAVSIGIFLFGYWFFKRNEGTYVDYK